MKRFIGLLLVLVLVLSGLGLRAEAGILSGECGTNSTWSLNTLTSTLTISGTGVMKDYWYDIWYECEEDELPSNTPWYEYRSMIRTIIVEDGITEIGKQAFCGLNALENLHVPSSVRVIGRDAFFDTRSVDIHIQDPYAWFTISAESDTSRPRGRLFANGEEVTSYTMPEGSTKVRAFAFQGLTNLTTVNIPEGVEAIGNRSFYNCTGLTHITLPESMKTIEELAFYGCTGLTELVIPDNVTEIWMSAFKNCTGLTRVTLGSGLTSIGQYAFQSCSALTELHWNAAVETIGTDAFDGCGGIKDLYLTDLKAWMTETTNSMERPNFAYGRPMNFYLNGQPLRDLVIPEGITAIPDVSFMNCSNLNWVTFPDSLTQIGANGFSYCTSLTEISLEGKVETLGSAAFKECDRLESITVGGSISRIGSYAFGGCDNVEAVIIGGSTVTVGGNAFYALPKLKQVRFQAQNTTVGTYAFENCTALEELDFGSGSISLQNNAFEGCSGLSRLLLSGGEMQLGSNVFKDCTGLREVVFGPAVTQIEGSIFGSCTNLETITVDGENPSYTSLEGVLYTKDLTELIQYPQAAKGSRHTIPDTVRVIRANAFSDCVNLKAVELPENLTTIETGTFKGCTGLESITFPDSLTTIGSSAFYNCTALRSAPITDHITTIGGSAFRNCCALTSVVIPDTVQSIGAWAFGGCTGLQSAVVGGGLLSIPERAFVDCTGLRTLTINYGVMQIGMWVFDNCTSLRIVSLPETITGIAYQAFYKCDAIQEVHYGGTEAQRKNIEVNYYNDSLKNATWYYGACNHSYSTWAQTVEATCTTPGEEQRLCSKCGEAQVRETALAAHSVSQWSRTAEPTCTESGEETGICETCGQNQTRKVDVLNHSYDRIITAPTCTVDGCTTYTCKACGDSYTGNVKKAIGHVFSDWGRVIAPTVYSAGEERRDCGNCDHYETRPVEALDLTAPVVKISGNSTTGKPKLSWKTVEGADLYRIYRAVGSTGSYFYYKSTRSTEFTDTQAKAGTNYYYKVLARNEETEKNSPYSNIVNRCCDLAKPVVTLKVDTASGKPKITFGKISGAEKYYIVRSTSRTGTYSKLATITGTSYIDKTAKAGTNYYYKVKALHAKDAADSAYSSVVNRVCDLAKPKVSISYSSTSGKPIVKWGTVSGAAKYRVYRSTKKDSGYELVYTAVTARTYTDKTAKAGTNYYYKVMAVHTNSAADSAYSAIVNRMCDLAKPVISITRSNGDPKVSWETVEGAEKYEVWRATSKSGTYKKVKTAISARSFTDTSVTAGMTYYYKVRAIHAKEAANSAYSSVKYITAK